MTFLSLILTLLVVVIGCLIFSRFVGFRAQHPGHYRSEMPEFDLRRDMTGKMLCEGMIYGPFGRVTSRFVAVMDADWDGNKGTIKEVFHYNSGNIQHRAWTLDVDDTGRVLAEADDLHGTGIGQQAGSAVMLTYNIELTKEAGGHVLSVTDWMYLLENGTIMNRSQFRKFGIKVAELVATMRPMPDKESDET